MPLSTVAAVTIGQSPRPDVVPEIAVLLDPHVRVVELGVLDGMTPEEVARLRPVDDDDTLVTRLRDGQVVLLDRRRIFSQLQACIDRVQDDVDLIMMLCTGTFPPFESRRQVLYPEHLLFQLARAVTSGAGVGVLTPSPRQIHDQERRWGQVASAVTVRAFSPYTPGDDLDGACAAFRAAEVSLVVLDCLGYTCALKQEVRRRVERPVLLARTVLGRVASELLV